MAAAQVRITVLAEFVPRGADLGNVPFPLTRSLSAQRVEFGRNRAD